jgi:hypothetical protein
MTNPRFIYNVHASLERKIKRNRYLSFIDLLNNINLNLNSIIFLKNFRGETLLHTAVKFKRTNIIQYLLNNFSNLKMYKNHLGETPFFYACKVGYIYIVRLFLRYDFICFINEKDNNLYSPLLKSYSNGHFPIANLLLEKGADWNVIARDGYVIPQNYIYNFINRNNTRFHRLSLSPIQSPLSSTPSSLSPPVDPFFDSEQLLGIFNTFEQNFFEDVSKIKVIKPNNEIINTIKKLYIDKNETCPITYESLTIETISITSCYHVFNKDAITNWFKTKNNCPVCRERCEIW